MYLKIGEVIKCINSYVFMSFILVLKIIGICLRKNWRSNFWRTQNQIHFDKNFYVRNLFLQNRTLKLSSMYETRRSKVWELRNNEITKHRMTLTVSFLMILYNSVPMSRFENWRLHTQHRKQRNKTLNEPLK